MSGVAEAGFEAAWRSFLHNGLLPRSAYPVVTPALKWDSIAKAVAAARPAPDRLSADHLELILDRDAKVDDGRFANNGWLQELPDPVSKLTWDNAASLSPETARKLGVANGDIVRLDLDGRTLEIAALILPGQADFSVAVSLGYGRTMAGRVGRGVGFNAYALRTAASPDIAVGLKVTRTGRKYPVACTQDHFTMEGRDLVRELSLADLLGRAGSVPDEAERMPGELITRPALDGEHQWGMAIDLNTCVGCNACVVACQSENNIPIVGKDEVSGVARCTGSGSTAISPGRRPTPSWSISRWPASTARRPPARWSARSMRRCTARRGLTSWSTTGASARATVRTTARTRCAGSTTSITTSGPSISCGTAPGPRRGCPRP